MSENKYNLTPETTLREYGIANSDILDSNQFISAVLVGPERVEMAINCESHLLVHVTAQLTVRLMHMGKLPNLTNLLEESTSPK